MNHKLREEFPAIPENLLEALSKMFPAIHVSPGMTMDVLMFNAGRLDVLEKLRELKEWQKHNHVSSQLKQPS